MRGAEKNNIVLNCRQIEFISFLLAVDLITALVSTSSFFFFFKALLFSFTLTMASQSLAAAEDDNLSSLNFLTPLKWINSCPWLTVVRFHRHPWKQFTGFHCDIPLIWHENSHNSRKRPVTCCWRLARPHYWHFFLWLFCSIICTSYPPSAPLNWFCGCFPKLQSRRPHWMKHSH